MFMIVSLAFAAGEQAGGQQGSPLGFLGSLLPILLIFPIFYFLVIMPQQKARKKHRAMMESLKKGDRVVSTAGIIGTIVSVDKDTVVLQAAPEVKLRILRSSVADLRAEE